jgi:hypothetical protein
MPHCSSAFVWAEKKAPIHAWFPSVGAGRILFLFCLVALYYSQKNVTSYIHERHKTKPIMLTDSPNRLPEFFAAAAHLFSNYVPPIRDHWRWKHGSIPHRWSTMKYLFIIDELASPEVSKFSWARPPFSLSRPSCSCQKNRREYKQAAMDRHISLKAATSTRNRSEVFSSDDSALLLLYWLSLHHYILKSYTFIFSPSWLFFLI